MGFSYIKSKLAIFDGLRVFHSNKILIQDQLLHGFNFTPCKNAVLSSIVQSKSRTFSAMVHFIKSRKIHHWHDAFLNNIPRRFYHTNPNPLYEPMPISISRLARSCVKPHNAKYYLMTSNNLRHLSPKASKIGDFFICCIVITILFGIAERVPYTGRIHLVFPDVIVRKFGDYAWSSLKKEYEGRILPPTDPRCIRVGRVTNEIVQAMHTGLRLETKCSVNGYEDSEILFNDVYNGNLSSVVKIDEYQNEDMKNNRLITQNVVQERGRKKSKNFIWKPSTKHLDGLNWEVIVIDSYIVNACCIPGGKIAVYKGLLNHVKSDAELATVIGHEVGHGVARHSAEVLIRTFFMLILLWFLCMIKSVSIHEIRGASELFNVVQIRLNRRREVEADYIGMMLMASAGYDPRKAPDVYGERLGGDSEKDEFLSTHPCGQKRAKWLKKTKVMEEAMAVYNEVKAGYGIRSFV